MIEAQGKLIVDQRNRKVVVEVCREFGRYYTWFITKEFWMNIHPPAWGWHITLTNPKLSHTVNWKKAVKLNNYPITFKFDEYMRMGGQSKGFTNFYFKVHSKEIEDIKQHIGVVESDDYRGMHITIGNTKNGTSPYWPQMIELKGSLSQRIKAL